MERLGAKHLATFEQAQIETDPGVDGRARHLAVAFFIRHSSTCLLACFSRSAWSNTAIMARRVVALHSRISAAVLG